MIFAACASPVDYNERACASSALRHNPLHAIFAPPAPRLTPRPSPHRRLRTLRTLLRIMRSIRPPRSSYSQLLAVRRSRIPAAQPDPYGIHPQNTPHLPQGKESSRSFRTLVFIGVAAACAILTLFSARRLHAAGRTPCRLFCACSVGRALLSNSARPLNPRTSLIVLCDRGDCSLWLYQLELLPTALGLLSAESLAIYNQQEQPARPEAQRGEQDGVY